MSDRPQSFENHAILITGDHKVAFSGLLFLIITAIVGLVRDFSFASVVPLVSAITMLLVAFYARIFALGAQDRVIRLEEQLRMERILPDDQKARMDEITTSQIIGLRFAPDEELSGLVGQVLDGSLTTRKEIKAAIKNWKADNQRL